MKLKALVISVIFLLGNLCVIGQNIVFGLQPVLGFRGAYNEFGVAGIVRYADHYDFELGFALGRFNGDGISTGLNYSIGNRRLRPTLGLSYLKCWGNTIDVTAKGVSTQFRIDPCEFVYFKAGLQWQLSEEELEYSGEKVQYCLTFSYRVTDYSDPTMKYVQGAQNYPEEAYLNKRIGEGWGICLSAIRTTNWGSRTQVEGKLK